MPDEIKKPETKKYSRKIVIGFLLTMILVLGIFAAAIYFSPKTSDLPLSGGEPIPTVNLGLPTEEGAGGLEKADVDGDGLTDNIEKMLGSDPYKKDTDGDKFNDLEELLSGYSPMLPRPWDKYTEEEFAKVKEDVKYASADAYNNLFGEE